MDFSHSTRSVHHPDTRHTQRQLHTSIQEHNQSQLRHESFPPSKRRCANSAHPSDPSSSEPSALSPIAHQQSRHSKPPHGSHHLIVETSAPRALSPDQVSRLSATSNQSTSGPQLRKKPKSSSIKHTHHPYARLSSTEVIPSLSALQLSVRLEQELSLNTGALDEHALPSISRANSQNLSPNQRRPPASHSSYGVETICGPPPSYSTQRTLSQERIRKLDRSSQTRLQTFSDCTQVTALDDTLNPPSSQRESVNCLTHSSPDTTDTQSVPTPTELETMSSFKVQGEPRTSTDEDAKASSSDERKSEDLFLNIARGDTFRPPIPGPKTEKKRSRISMPFLPSSRSAQGVRSSPTQPPLESASIMSPQSGSSYSHSKRASMGGYIPSPHAPRSYLGDGGRIREHPAALVSDNERSENQIDGPGLRRSSTTATEPARLVHRSSAGLRGSRLVSELVHNDRSRISEQIATESTVSTTAPSTVWDELDDLKSRIHKLELTGKLPSSSAAAMISAERPRTATTAATTMSASPKHRLSETNLPSPIEGVPSNIHPLLHEALDNAKANVSHDIYQKLQATAQDALQLVALMNPDHATSHESVTVPGNDRQIKRRAEGICRGLTELAIALAAEAKPLQSSMRPVSREQSLPPNSMLRSRRYSSDPADRTQAPTRVQSRLDSRRTSVNLARNGTAYTSPERGPFQSPSSASQVADPRVHRSSTLLRNRGQGSFDGTDEQYDVSPSVRPGSRAMTDLGTYRRNPRDQMQPSREYTNQYPFPSQHQPVGTAATQSSPAYNTPFTSRRKYASPVAIGGTHDDSPITLREGWGRSSTVPMDAQYSDMILEADVPRGVPQQSIGYGSRIGSSVGSRLRAVRAERNNREHADRVPLHSEHTNVNTCHAGDG